MTKEKPLSEKLIIDRFPIGEIRSFKERDVAEAVKKLKDVLFIEALDRKVPLTDSKLDRLPCNWVNRKIDKIFGSFDNHSPQKKKNGDSSRGNHLETQSRAGADNLARDMPVSVDNQSEDNHAQDVCGEIELRKEDLEYCSPEFEHYMDTGETIDKPCKCHKGFGNRPKCEVGK